MHRQSLTRQLPRWIALFLAAVGFMASAQARQITLVWNASADPDVAAYRLYYGTVSGNYNHQLDVGVATMATVSDLADRLTYYFVVTAYTFGGAESPPSNEVSHGLPPSPDPTPTPTPTPGPTLPPTPFPSPSPVPTPTPDPGPIPTPAQPLNISTRLRVETGDNVMIGGFVVSGNASKQVVLRGMGPSLSQWGLVDVLAEPVLELYGANGALILRNDNWKDTQRSQIEGTIFQPSNDLESVIVATLQPGAYTGILTGKDQTTGVGLMEVYDIDQAADSQLANISTRGFVQNHDNVMSGGFVLGGNSAHTRVAVRGIGPSLTQFGLSNVLADPTLELHDSNGTTLISDDNWTDDPVQAAQLTANGLGLTSNLESGIFTVLPPGAFTVILAGKNGGIGVGVVEVYNLR